MATAAKHLFSSLHHHSSSRHSSASSKTAPKKKESVEQFNKNKEDEKHLIASWDNGTSAKPLTPVEVCKDPEEKHIGYSTKHLQWRDFKIITTLGTGMYSADLLVTCQSLYLSRHFCESLPRKASTTTGWRRREGLCAQDLAQSRQ